MGLRIVKQIARAHGGSLLFGPMENGNYYGVIKLPAGGEGPEKTEKTFFRGL